MTTDPFSSSPYLKTLTIFFLALLSGQILFALIVWAARTGEYFLVNLDDLDAFLLIIAPMAVLTGIWTGNAMAKKRLAEIRTKANLQEKLADYQGLYIVRLALLEGPSLFSSLAFLITGNYVYLGLTALVALLFATKKPTKEKIAEELGLGHDAII
jgi:hypothetical protein